MDDYLGDAIRAARMSVREAYVYDGPEAALEAVALASKDLAPLVLSGNLICHFAWDALQEVSENLGLVRRFGQDAVQEAIAFGTRVCAAYYRHVETERAA